MGAYFLRTHAQTLERHVLDSAYFYLRSTASKTSTDGDAIMIVSHQTTTAERTLASSKARDSLFACLRRS